MHFLYIEDQEDSCDLVRKIFAGYEIVWAPTANDALKLVERDQSFDLYLIDHLLPDATGLELCRQIRHRDSRTPIVFVTGSTTLSICDVRDAGAQGLVRKANPTFIEQLKQIVADLTGSTASVRA